MSSHLGDLAQLFALGVLEPDERADIEAHLRACDDCSQEVGRAEATVAALTDATVPAAELPASLASRLHASASRALPVPRGARFATFASSAGWRAFAASVVLGIVLVGGALGRNAQLRNSLRADDLAFATIATSHFRHTDFVGRTPAKVLYARDGSWVYLIVDEPACQCRLVGRATSEVRDLGVPEPRGETATLFVARANRPHMLELVDAQGSVLATATLVY